MANQSTFPTTLDGTPADKSTGDLVPSLDWNQYFDAIDQLEQKVGVDGSAVATTIDYLLKSEASIDPGHKHSYQPSDATLTALAGLTITNGSLIIGTGSDSFSVLSSGASGYVITSNNGTPVWAASSGGGGGLLDPAECSVFYDDFISLSRDGLGLLLMDYIWWEDAVATTQVSPDRNGIITIVGAGGIFLLANDAHPPYVKTKNPIVHMREAQYGSDMAMIRYMGLWGAISIFPPVNGIYFRHAHLGNYFAVCRSGGVESVTDTGVAAADGVFHTLKLVITAASVTPYIDGVAKTAITTNIPAGNLFFMYANDTQYASTGLYADYVYISQDR